MSAEGLQSLFPMEELSVMGLVEILPHLGRFKRRIRDTVEAIRALSPHAVLTIDAKGFSFRVLRAVRTEQSARAPVLVHYVAPSVWAYKGAESRARRLQGLVDHLFAILPFEQPLMRSFGVPTTFVGHPSLEDAMCLRATHDAQSAATPSALPDTHWALPPRHFHPPQPYASHSATAELAVGTTRLCVLPGSRMNEVQNMGPVLVDAVTQLAQHVAKLEVVVPTVDAVHDHVRRLFESCPVPVHMVNLSHQPPRHQYTLFASCDAAVAASGTVVTELAIAGVPTVVAYRAHPLTALIARLVANVRFVSLPNLLLGRPALPEFLFADCRAAPIASALRTLLTSEQARRHQRHDMRAALAIMAGEQPCTAEPFRSLLNRCAAAHTASQYVALSPGSPLPSERAAHVLLDLLRSRYP